jgi:hypothetical protein
VDDIFSAFIDLPTIDEALACLEEMPEELKDHQGMAVFVNNIMKYLATAAVGDANAVKDLGKVIDRIAKEAAKNKAEEGRKCDMLRQAGDVLATRH